MWPDLLLFIQRTLNTTAQTGQGEIEMMMYLESERVAALQRGEAPDWAPIIQQTKTSLPKCSAYLHILAKCLDASESQN